MTLCVRVDLFLSDVESGTINTFLVDRLKYSSDDFTYCIADALVKADHISTEFNDHSTSKMCTK